MKEETKVTEPESVEPEITETKTTEPKAVEPKAVEPKVVKTGPPWSTSGVFDSYADAVAMRKEIEDKWTSEKTEGMEIKIRLRNSDDRFAVKTRAPQVEKVKKKTKSKKKKKEKTENG